jgi:putative hydrolase of the HAD superfamily
VIKTVIFDLGNVIVPFDFRRGYERLSPVCGLEPVEIPKRIGSTDLVARYESGLVTSPDFVRELGTLLGFEMAVEEFAGIWSIIFDRETLIPDSLPEQIRAAGFRLLLLSNTNDLHFQFIEQNYSILRHFHEFILSYKVKAMKPRPEIFAEAIRVAGCEPSEIFFTDDVPAYVAGARKAGIDAVQFQSYGQIRGELAARGVVA